MNRAATFNDKKFNKRLKQIECLLTGELEERGLFFVCKEQRTDLGRHAGGPVLHPEHPLQL